MTEIENELNLSLGDIIKVKSPYNDLNNKIFYIEYIDSKKITIVNDEKVVELNLLDGNIEDNKISEIIIVLKSTTRSYAKLNNLNVGTMIEIKFNNDYTLSGEITNLIEDMIEIDISESDKIYIDFEYKGISSDLNINYIEIISKNDEEDEEEEDLDPIMIEVNLDLKNKRFTVQEQKDDMINNFINDINYKSRSKHMINNIVNQVNRFFYLREKYSEMDDNDIPISIYINKNKPLVKSIYSNDKVSSWCIPLSNVIPKCDQLHSKRQCKNVKFDDIIIQDYEQQNIFYQNLNEIEEIKEIRKNYLKYLNETTKPFVNINSNDKLIVNKDITSLIQDDDKNVQLRFVSKIINNMTSNDDDKEVLFFEPEIMDIMCYITLPYPFINYAKMYTPSSLILERTLISKNSILLNNILKMGITMRNITNSNMSNERFFGDIIQHNKKIDDLDLYLNTIIPSTEFIVRNIILELKKSYNCITLYQIHKNLQCFNIDINLIDIICYNIIQNELNDNLNKFIKKYEENNEILKSNIKNEVKKRESIKLKNSFDYLIVNNDNDVNVKNQIDFFIKYLKLKYKDEIDRLNISEILERIRDDDIYNLYIKVLNLKNIFDGKINYNEITKQINKSDELEEIEEIDIDNILEETVNNYQENIIEYLQEIEGEFNTNRSNSLKKIEKDKMNIRNINNLLEDVEIVEVCSSPYYELRDKILDIKNKIEKNNSILKFIHQYCRKCSKNEKIEDANSVYWYFCRETNCKLLPTFYYDIAVSVIEHSLDSEYQKKVIETICKNRGTIERGKTIDVHTGFTILDSTFMASYQTETDSNEVEYEEEDGYVNYGGIELNEEEEDIIEEEKEVIDIEESEDYDFNFFVEEKMGKELKLKDFDEFDAESYSRSIIKKVSDILGIHLTDKYLLDISTKVVYIFNIYNKDMLFSLDNTKDNQKIMQYKIYLVLYSVGILFVNIQMMDLKDIYRNEGAINLDDLLRMKKGFPLYEETDYSGIELYSKRLKKISNIVKDKGFTECLQLEREKNEQTDFFLKNVVKFIKKNLLKSNRFNYEINQFKQNLIKEDDIRLEISKKYSNILPPLNKYPYIESNDDIEGLSDDIHRKIFKSFNKIEIIKNINILKSKNIYCSYGLMEKLNKSISNEVLLLKNYLDNTCCNKEGDEMFNIFDYLKDSYINKIVKTVNASEKILSDVSIIYNMGNVYNNIEISKYRLSDEKYNFLANSMDIINKEIDPNNDVISDIGTLYEKLKYLYESKKGKKLDFNIQDEVLYEELDEEDDKDDMDDKDVEVRRLFIKLVNDKDDNNEYEKTIYKYNNKYLEGIYEKMKLTKEEKRFFNPEFNNDNILKMKSHIKEYIYVALNEKISNKKIVNVNNQILKSWGLSKNDSIKLGKYIMAGNVYKDYDNEGYEEDTIDIMKEIVEYYKENKNFIDNLEEMTNVTNEMVMLYLKYFYLKMLNKLLNSNLDVNDEIKIKEYLKKCINFYLSTYNVVNINVKEVEKGVIMSKEDEKDVITDKFSKMSKQQIAVSYELRNNKLGEYGVGLQKGFHKYNKKFEDNN